MEYNSQYNPQYNSGGAQGGYGYQPDPSDTLRIMRREKRQIRKLGNISGLGILLFALFQFVGAGILFLLNLFDDYANSTDRGYAIGVMMSVFCIFVPFFLTSLLLKDKRQQCLNFGKPYDMRLMFLAVPVGLMICMIGNYATNFLSTFVETATGITFEYPDSPTPTSPLGIAMYLLQLAVVPALVEEYALRGVVMMPARKFGNWFAVLVSSALFGMMHGNLVQAPFAFIVGIGIGYFVIVTGTSPTHIKALSDDLEDKLAEKGKNAKSVEGKATGWILLDYGTVIVHVFTKESRENFNLEKLWGDAEEVDVSEWISE